MKMFLLFIYPLILFVVSCIQLPPNPYDDKGWLSTDGFQFHVENKFLPLLLTVNNYKEFIEGSHLDRGCIVLNCVLPKNDSDHIIDYYEQITGSRMLTVSRWTKFIIDTCKVNVIKSSNKFLFNGSLKAHVVYKKTVRYRVPPGTNPWGEMCFVLYVDRRGEIVAWSVSNFERFLFLHQGKSGPVL